MKVYLLVALLALSVYSQTTVRPAGDDLFAIDSFTASETDFLVIDFDLTSTFPLSKSSITSGDGILGGERDHYLQVDGATASNSLSSSIDLGSWSANTPRTGSGFAYIQWDGVDSSVSTLSSGLDLDFGTTGNYLHIRVGNDVSTTYEFRLASSGGAQCFFSYRSVGAVPEKTDVYIPFSSFTGNCNWNHIGGIETRIILDFNVDATLYWIGVFGNLPSQSATPTPTPTGTRTPSPAPSQPPTLTPTPTGTRTPSPAPSQPPTPTPTPTQTRTPSAPPSAPPTPTPTPTRSGTPTGTRTPTPTRTRTPTPTMMVDWYTFDDDDEGKSPCSDDNRDRKRTYFLSDDNIIYYYFYGFGDDHDGGAGLGLFTESVGSAGELSIAYSLVLAVVLMAVL